MQVSFRTIQLTDGKKRVNGALRARAAVRPALRQGSEFLIGAAGGRGGGRGVVGRGKSGEPLDGPYVRVHLDILKKDLEDREE